MSQTSTVKVIVLCHDLNGLPTVHTCTPEVTQEQLQAGEHLALAKEHAGYYTHNDPMVAFDASHDVADELLKSLAWLKS